MPVLREVVLYRTALPPLRGLVPVLEDYPGFRYVRRGGLRSTRGYHLPRLTALALQLVFAYVLSCNNHAAGRE